MGNRGSEFITVEALINAPVATVWKCWTTPADIMNWNNASDDWHTTKAENDLRVGGRFLARMEAKDGSTGFDFTGIYDQIVPNHSIGYAIADGRKVRISFQSDGQLTKVTETFETETVYSKELQQAGWQSILNNFKKYVEKE
jgi:uncharacterized protein YndB with AHSA1/START domain